MTIGILNIGVISFKIKIFPIRKCKCVRDTETSKIGNEINFFEYNKNKFGEIILAFFLWRQIK